MAVSDSAKEQARNLFGDLGPVQIKPMFGGASVMLDGAMFCLIARDEFYLKVDDLTERAFADAGSEPFVFTSKDGRSVSMRYWRLPDDAADDADAALGWGRLAVEAAFRARRPKRGGKAKPAPRQELLISGPWDDE